MKNLIHSAAFKLWKGLILISIFIFQTCLFAAEETKETPGPVELSSVTSGADSQVSGPASAGNVTFDFKEADINNVLKIISYKSGINIVTTPDVIGNVSVRLTDVPWEMALDVILKTYGFGYQRQGNIILVTKIENVAKIAAEEPLQTEIIVLKFLDAQDAQKIVIPLLSPRGKTSVLYARGQKGWQFGTFKIGKGEAGGAAMIKEAAGATRTETVSFEKTATGETVMKKADFDPSVKSKILIITDTFSTLDRIRNIILPKIDVKPKQVLIETKIIEVNRNKLRDLGLDWGLGSAGAARTTAISMGNVNDKGSAKLGGHGGTIGSAVTPSIFSPSTSGIVGVEPYNAGAELVFQKLTGTRFEAVVHALEDDANTNTLSAPRIMTLDNQEASMLVGFHTPILGSTVTAGTDTGSGPTITQTLDYYQEIGIRLNVVPQISEEGYINMIIHPSITSSNADVAATSIAGTGTTATTTTTNYPIIDVREAQTQVMIKDGETVVIGGLLKDVKSTEYIGIPFLKDIPWVGRLFGRETVDTEKIDLLIFITARIIKDGDFSPEEIARLEKSVGQGPVVVKVEAKDKKKK